MRVAVVTPYYRESIEMIRKAHDSVVQQDFRCTHVIVADGFASQEIDRWDCHHLKLPLAHGDAGSFARGVGGLHAISKKYDFVAFLDADCWFDRDHIASLVNSAMLRNAKVSVSRRRLIRLDGTILETCDSYSDGVKFADTNTVLIRRDAADLLSVCTVTPPELGGIGDTLVWQAALHRKYNVAQTGKVTVNYVTKYKPHYDDKNEAYPPGAVDNEVIYRARDYWNSLPQKVKQFYLSGHG